MNAPHHSDKHFIGRGRSAKVYLSSMQGRQVATKVFVGEYFSKIILYVLTGAGNPYTWCEHAVNTAISRRRILTHLCQYWFGQDLRLPETLGSRWNDEYKAYEIDAEFISGKHAPLLYPNQKFTEDDFATLKHKIMVPLQQHLIQAGFDGLVWQAGKGNPVGVSNFMMQRDDKGESRWIWIDLESGLPALFALNPVATLNYYLPMCFKHRGWLFDDVDLARLESYLADHRQNLSEQINQSLSDELNNIKVEQRQWKGLGRHQRSVEYAFSQGKINPQQKQYFESRPLRWLAVMLGKGTVSVISSIGTGLKNGARFIRNFKYRKFLHRIFRYFTNSYYRWRFIRWFVGKEVNRWHQRGFLSSDHKQVLERELHEDEISAYLTDFSIHIGIKPFVKAFQWSVIPVLMATGTIGLGTGALLLIWAGPMARTLYTSWRIGQSMLLSRSHYPFVALAVGMLPMVGNLAYPVEILYQSSGKGNLLGRFMTCAFSAKVGSKIPFWGGPDTEVEHFFNRLGYRISKMKFSLR